MQADSSGRPRDALPGISQKLDRVSAEMVYRTMCDAEAQYLRERNAEPPVAEEKLGRLAGFEILARPTYTEVRRVYSKTGVDELTRTKSTGLMAQLNPNGAWSNRPQAAPPPPSDAGTPPPSALRKGRSTPTLKDLLELQSSSNSNEALGFVYKYFSEDHMAAKESKGRTRGGPAAPIPRSGKKAVAVGAPSTAVVDASKSADVSPSSVSRGVQCDNRRA